MAANKYWIVVAESSHARIFHCSKPGAVLIEETALVHPESRLHAQDIHSDLPGRAFDSGGEGRHAMSADTDPKRHEAEVFARELIAHIESGRTGGMFEELVLAAAPAFLGLLRERMSSALRQRVIHTVSKNLVHEDKAVITRQLGPTKKGIGRER
ncbi:MAG: host attachment protein [Gammaproteobacteria bacterium]|nr:host attachment protein [Gammaproteobacteria bacterium]